MGKYLTNFKTKEEYEAFKAGGSYLTPNVSFIETAGSVINDSYQVPTSGEGVGYLYFENIPLNAVIEVLAFSSLINNGTQIIPSFLCGFNSQGKEENITVRKIAAMYGYTFNDMKITEDFLREFMSIGGNIVEITEEEFYRMPHNVVLEDGASDDIKIVFEDLMSKISSYPSDEKFDSPLSSYGYDSISFGGNSFTRVGKYSLNVFGGRDIIYLMISEGDNPEDGWGLYRDNTVSPKEYGLNYPG